MTMVSNLSMAFKKATILTEDVEEAKKEHRQGLKTLVDKYYTDVQAGKAEGIRTAKELAEIIKLDLLLMGEVTDRQQIDSVDEARTQRIQQVMDMDSPEIQDILAKMMGAINGANDDADSYKPVTRVSIGSTEDNGDSGLHFPKEESDEPDIVASETVVSDNE